MKNNTAANKEYGPFMMLARGDLNPEFTKGLETAFEQANCMFRADADLVIENQRNTKRKMVCGLTLDTW